MYYFKCYLVIVFSVISCVLAHTSPPAPDEKPPWNATWTDKLKWKLLTHYDKFSRPAQHTNTTIVKIRITFRHIELDEFRSIMTVHTWLRMFWIDEKLRWNENEWGGLRVLHLADHEVWQPDVVLYNSATGSNIDHYGNTHCLAYANGDVLWVPPAQFLVFCDLNLRLWPFDTQTCHMTLGSWTYDGNQINLTDDGTELDIWDTNSEWQVEEVKSLRNVTKYSCCPEPYIDILYTVRLRRQSPAYSAIVITPATAIVWMTLAGFWLPPNAGEKLLLNGCTAIIICMFLLYFSQKLPAMAGHTPLVVLFYSSSLYLIIFSMVVSVVVLNLSRNYYRVSVPWVLKSLLFGWPGRLLGLHYIVLKAPLLEDQQDNSGGIDDGNTETSSAVGSAITDDCRQILGQASTSRRNHADWILLAVAIDRLCFLIYCMLFIILAIVYSV